MKPENEQFERFDPTDPVGQPDERAADGLALPLDEQAQSPTALPAQASPPSRQDNQDVEPDAQDACLIGLIDQATRPPADLRLDWGRLRASLAKEPMLRPAAPRRRWAPVFKWAALAAAALLLLATSISLLLPGLGLDEGFFRRGENQVATKEPDRLPTPSQNGVQTVASPANPSVVAGTSASEPTIALGLTPEAARQLAFAPSAEDRDGMVVVFPRRTETPARGGGNPPPVAEPSGPMVLTSRAPLGEADDISQGNDFENDPEFASF